MTYYNIIVSYGEAFFKNVKSRCLRRDYSDLPYELTQKLKHKISKFDVKSDISLISMTANDDRIKEIVKHL